MNRAHFLFFFLDGVGLGEDDPTKNPFARARLPNLEGLLAGQQLTAEALSGKTRLHTRRSSLIALDACLGVPGLPQSASGQATFLTGENIPRRLGYHYGPKPNPEIAAYLRNGNLFHRLTLSGRQAALLNAYPPRYFQAIHSGRRLYSAIPLAVASAGLRLMTLEDLLAGGALSADFTGEGWKTHLNQPEVLQLHPAQAGARLAQLARGYDFAFFEYWLSDYAGHQQDMAQACALLEQLDQVLGGLLDAWDDQRGLALITSDHGNLEDLSTRRHTENPVPAILIGAENLRQAFTTDLSDLASLYPAILKFFGLPAG